LTGSAVGVGRSGVCAWETFTVIQEIPQVPGIARVGIDFLRVGRAADMPHEASSPTLTQVHTLGVANADAICASGIPSFAGIANQVILAGNPQTVCEATQCEFVLTEYNIDWDDSPADVPEMGFEGADGSVVTTPSLSIVAGEQGHTASTPARLVNHTMAVANATQGHTAQGAGFGTRTQNVANAEAVYAVGAPRMNKIIIPDSPVWSNQATTNSTQRLYVLDAANSTQGHIALTTGVSPEKINTVLASNGFTATPASITFLARTFPHESTTGMIVSPPTMSQNITAPATDVGQFFGSKLGAIGTNGLQIGNAGTHPNTPAIAYRFRADKTDTISFVRVLTYSGTGFSLGEAKLEARILRDSNTTAHTPVDSQRTSFTTSGETITYTGTSAHIGAVSDVISISGVATSALVVFNWSSGAPSLVKNNIYHLEIRNAHASPDSNYVSLTTLFSTPSATPSHPGYIDADLGVSRRGTGGVWSAMVQDTPIFGLYFTNGQFQGQGYRNSLITPLPSITGPLNKVRQKFVPNGDLRVHKIGYRVARWSGSQPLQVRIRRDSDNAVLASAAADHSYFNTVTNQTDPRPEHQWHYNTFVSSFPLTAGVTAALEFQTTANAEYRSNIITGSQSIGVCAAFWQGSAESTIDGTNWVQTGIGTNDLQFYFGLGSAAPAPTCVADTIANVFIGVLRDVSAQELIANDRNPGGNSATSTLPTGVNPLVINHVNSASNCTASLVSASQIVRVTAQATGAGGFTYVARDIYGQRSSARVSFTATQVTVPTSSFSKRPIWVAQSITTLSDSVLLAYNARRAPTLYWSAFDPDTNGDWDSISLNSLTSANAPLVVIDWESATNSFGTYRVPGHACGGFGGPGTPSTSLRSFNQNQMITLIQGYKNARPNSLWGYYWVPNANTIYDYVNITASSHSLYNQHVVGLPVYQESDFLSPRAYVTLDIGTTAGGPYVYNDGLITEANLELGQRKMAQNALRCAEAAGNIPVYPFISTSYYGPTKAFVGASAQLIYKYAYYFCRTSRDGVKPTGAYIWDSVSSPQFTEAQLKAVYQGVNELPFDPNMPRPS
jgi:hypothetical protein